MANPLEGLPPNIQQFVMQMLGPEPEDPFADLLKQIEQQSTQARGAARDALKPLQALQGAPMPQTSPGTDAMTELLGGLSQMLAPEMGGLQQARGARAGVEDDMQKRRLTRLATMEKHYDELAERADQLGNTELSLKMRAKAETFAAKQKRDAEARDLGTKLYEGQKDREGAMARTQVQEAGATERTKIGADAGLQRVLARNPGLTIDPATGDVRPLEGVEDNAFNERLVPLVTAYSNARGSKKNDILPDLKSFFAQKKQSEAFNSTSYINRLRFIGDNKKAGPLSIILGGGRRYSDAEIARYAANNYNVDVTGQGGPGALIAMLEKAGYSNQKATDAVNKLLDEMM